MTRISTANEGLAQVRELNRLFLTFLRGRLAKRGVDMGLPGSTAGALARASDDLVARLSAFPQAMFRLNLDALADNNVLEPAAEDLDSALSALQLMLLVGARNLARSNPYAARLFLRLSNTDQARLHAIAVTDLPVVSRRHDVVRCAYRDLAWMWPELLRSKEPDKARGLILLGLQPRTEINPPISLHG